MEGVVGVESCAPKAGALPGCATPRHLLRIDSTALLRSPSIDPSPTVHELCKIAPVSATLRNHQRSKSLKTGSVFDSRIVADGTPCPKGRCALCTKDFKKSNMSADSRSEF